MCCVDWRWSFMLEGESINWFLSLLTVFLYVLVYTPMKKMSWLNTTIGADSGAIPPLGGWRLPPMFGFGGGFIFDLFAWQHPPFLCHRLDVKR